MTWQDIKKIVEIADKSLEQCKAEHWSEEQYYTNILNMYESEK